MNNISNEILKWNFKNISSTEWSIRIKEELAKIPLIQKSDKQFFYKKDDLAGIEIPLVFPKAHLVANSKIPFAITVTFISSEESYDTIINSVNRGIQIIYLDIPLESVKNPDFLKFLRRMNSPSFKIFFDFRKANNNVIFQTINEEFYNTLLERNITGGIFLNNIQVNEILMWKNNLPVSKFFICHNIHCEEMSIGEILALGVNCIQNSELPVTDAFSKIQFTVDIGDDYFQEISKARALRFLWYQIGKIYLAQETPPETEFHALILNNSKEVDYNDVLTATTRIMSAFMGGYDSILISGTPLKGSEAIKKTLENIPHILQEESSISDIVDPGKGSYYIEKETMLIAEEGWESFLQIEKKGGYFKYKS